MSRVRSSSLADRTPPDRDRYLDLLRGVAILAVVVGHWLVVVPRYEPGGGAGGRFDGVNALEHVALARALTWVFQVMPLFFIVGGVANARSWRSASARGDGYAHWLRGRVRRLVAPSAWFVAAWVALGMGLRWRGMDAQQVHTLAWVAVVPVWFLAVYLLVAVLAPPALAAHRRWGWRVLPVLLAAAVIVDVFRMRDGDTVLTATNFLWVFLFAQQLGFLWVDGGLPASRRAQWTLLVGSMATMAALVVAGRYPASLVGVPGEAIQNNAPPTVMLALAGLMQLGGALLARAKVAPVLERRRVWATVVTWNAHAMTVLLWHLTALVVAAVVLLPAVDVPVPRAGSFGWWVVRVLWLLVYAVPLVVLLSVFGRVERRSLLGSGRVSGRVSGRAWGRASGRAREARRAGAGPGVAVIAVVCSAVCVAVGFSNLAVGGLSRVEVWGGVPVAALGWMTAGAALLGVRERRPASR